MKAVVGKDPWGISPVMLSQQHSSEAQCQSCKVAEKGQEQRRGTGMRRASPKALQYRDGLPAAPRWEGSTTRRACPPSFTPSAVL